MDFLEALLRLIWLPYNWWKQSIENSTLGASEEDRKTLRFWKRVAIVGVTLLVAAGLVAVVFIVVLLR